MPYVYLEDRATADAAFRAWGTTLEELFKSCADALLAVMVSDPEHIHPVEEKIVKLQGDSLELLLHNFLQEILYFKDAHQLFVKVKDIRIEPPKDEPIWSLQATFSGELIELHRDNLLADVKGVTFHDFSVERIDNRWEAVVIVDV
ncbi:MAG: archease [Syntrophobacterales bacterium]|nr:archease [Syntrophobacterales bacterium]